MTPPELVDDLVAVLCSAGTSARRRGRVVVVDGHVDGEPEQHLELVFFLRSWAITHPDVTYEVREAS